MSRRDCYACTSERRTCTVECASFAGVVAGAVFERIVTTFGILELGLDARQVKAISAFFVKILEQFFNQIRNARLGVLHLKALTYAVTDRLHRVILRGAERVRS